MHICEFCNTEYKPRPQVKKPRACKKIICQKKRQRSNEYKWRERHTHLSSSHYFQIKKKIRVNKLKVISCLILNCLHAGKEFMDIDFDSLKFSLFFEEFILQLGVRQINKFCHFDFDSIPEHLKVLNVT